MKLKPLPLIQIGLFSCAIASAAAVRYVDACNLTPTPPYTDWSTAATNIQDAVDAADPGDLVLVTNGLYQTGGAMVIIGFPIGYTTNRVAVTKPLTIQSVNGPAVTTIMGSQVNVRLRIPAVRCVLLTNGATLAGFTLTNGGVTSSPSEGGGVYAASSSPYVIPTALVSNCVLTGNSASTAGGGACGVALNNCILTGNTASTGGGALGCTLSNCTISNNMVVGNNEPFSPPPGYGGGAYACTMNNCLISGNSASVAGGGVSGGSFNNCTVVSNTAPASGGVAGVFPAGTAALTNCIVFDNSATNGPNYQAGPAFSHCCTTPLPTGTGNITNDPLFLNPSAGDYHLQTNSPCINGGYNSAVASATDLDGNPRIAGGTVDLGAYEFQTPASIISYAWLQQYGLPTDGSADLLDSDGDGMNNWQEWRAGTNPTNRSSVLQISSLSVTGAVATVRWESAAGVTYCLERSTNPAQPGFLPVQSNMAGVAGLSILQDTNAAAAQPVFYRLSVQ